MRVDSVMLLTIVQEGYQRDCQKALPAASGGTQKGDTILDPNGYEK